MKYRRLGKYKYILADQYAIDLPLAFYSCDCDTEFIILVNGRLLVKEGYCWDGPSGISIDTQTFMRGSLVHDVIYQLIRGDCIPKALRINADKLLRQICIKDGMARWRAWYVYRAVRMLGGSSCKPRRERFSEIITIGE